MAEDTLQQERRDRDPEALLAEIRQLEDQVSVLQGKVRSLQAEIRGMQNSLYWKITGPLRVLARRLPRLTKWGRQRIELLKDAVATGLPKGISQSLLNNRWHIPPDTDEQITAYQRARSAGTGERKVVVYTAIFGEHDNLLLPERIDPGVDYVCFTDRPRNTYGVWQMRMVPYRHPDPTRIARYVKLHPHELFPAHAIAIWLDANIILKGDLWAYVDLICRKGGDLGLVSHPHRTCFYEEAEACMQLRKDAVGAIQEQVAHYRERGLPENLPLYETGFMIVPLGSDRAREALVMWWQQIERFSRRDQLGLAWVSHACPELRIVPLLPAGSSVRDHEDFSYFRHSYARALAIPDTLLKHGRLEAPSAGHAVGAASDSIHRW